MLYWLSAVFFFLSLKILEAESNLWSQPRWGCDHGDPAISLSLSQLPPVLFMNRKPLGPSYSFTCNPVCADWDTVGSLALTAQNWLCSVQCERWNLNSYWRCCFSGSLDDVLDCVCSLYSYWNNNWPNSLLVRACFLWTLDETVFVSHVLWFVVF